MRKRDKFQYDAKWRISLVQPTTSVHDVTLSRVDDAGVERIDDELKARDARGDRQPARDAQTREHASSGVLVNDRLFFALDFRCDDSRGARG
jgi:hypothetical protein